MTRIASILIIFLMMVGCKGTKDVAVVESSKTAVVSNTSAISNKGSNYMLPQAVVYKTNGNYTDNVPITLNEQGTAIIAFPGPGDVSASNSTPIDLGDGWLLDRRGGIGTNTAFLHYTYKEYAALKDLPSTEELMKAIIPNAKVTEVKVLPIKLSKALENPELAKEYIKEVN